jgi:glycosyltransferase involved in cell wall biosynthesis
METLLQAMAMVRVQHPNLELVVIGRRGWKSSRVVRRLQELSYVQYLGYTTEEKKREVLACARAFIYPSLYEGFGFPPLEAQQNGVPVIAGAHSSLPEVVGESALLVDVLDADALARGIHHVLSDETLRQNLITAGLANVQRFSWEQSARKVLNVLTGV